MTRGSVGGLGVGGDTDGGIAKQIEGQADAPALKVCRWGVWKLSQEVACWAPVVSESSFGRGWARGEAQVSTCLLQNPPVRAGLECHILLGLGCRGCAFTATSFPAQALSPAWGCRSGALFR